MRGVPNLPVPRPVPSSTIPICCRAASLMPSSHLPSLSTQDRPTLRPPTAVTVKRARCVESRYFGLKDAALENFKLRNRHIWKNQLQGMVADFLPRLFITSIIGWQFGFYVWLVISRIPLAGKYGRICHRRVAARQGGREEREDLRCYCNDIGKVSGVLIIGRSDLASGHIPRYSRWGETLHEISPYAEVELQIFPYLDTANGTLSTPWRINIFHPTRQNYR